MIKRLILLFLLLIATSNLSFSETFDIKYIDNGPRYVKAFNKDDGKYLWECKVNVSTYEASTGTVIRITEDYKGLWNNKNSRIWNAECYYQIKNDQIIPSHGKLVFYDLNGVTLESIERKYSQKNNKAYFVKNKDKKKFDFDNDLLDKEVMATAMMSYPYDRDEDFVFHMMTNEPSHYKMTMVNKGVETITVNGKEIECYKVQMIPDLGILSIFGAFVPKTHFWHTKEPPHKFVRYEGLESGLNTPYIIIDSMDPL